MLRQEDSQNFGGTDSTRNLAGNDGAGTNVGAGTGRAILHKQMHGTNFSGQTDRGLNLGSDAPGTGLGSGPVESGPPPSSGKSKRFSKRQSKGVLAAVF